MRLFGRRCELRLKKRRKKEIEARQLERANLSVRPTRADYHTGGGKPLLKCRIHLKIAEVDLISGVGPKDRPQARALDQGQPVAADQLRICSTSVRAGTGNGRDDDVVGARIVLSRIRVLDAEHV